MNRNSIDIEVQEPSFSILSPTDDLSYFKDLDGCTSLVYDLDAAISDVTILLDDCHLPPDDYATLVIGIIQGTASIDTNLYVNGNNWVTASKINRSTYRSKLAGVIAALAVLDALVRYHNIIEGSVTIALDG